MVDISQETRIKKYNLFAKALGLPGIPATAQGGFCNGDAFIWAQSFKANRRQEFKNDCEFIAELSQSLIREIVDGHDRYIAECLAVKQRKGSLDEIAEELKSKHDAYFRIFQTLENTLFFFSPAAADKNLAQSDFDVAANWASGAISHSPQGEVSVDPNKQIQKEYSFSYIYEQDSEIELSLKAFIKPNKILMIGSSNHATALIYDGSKYHYYDPNKGEMEFDNLTEVVKAIKVAMQAEMKINADNLPEGVKLGLTFTSLDYVKNQKGDYLSYDDHLLQLNSISKSNGRINLQATDGATALYVAAQAKNAELIDTMLKNSADPNLVANSQMSPLHIAAQEGDVASVKKLLAAKANQNQVGQRGMTPLLSACSGSTKKEIVELLLNSGADINARNMFKTNALMLSIFLGADDTAKFLIERGADLKIEGEKRFTAIFFAASKSQEVFFALLKKDPSLIHTVYPVNGSNLYHFAAQSDFGVSLLEFLQKEWKVVDFANTPNGENQTPFHFACRQGNIANIKYLISKGANINAQDIHGKTPLMHAIETNQIDVVKLLLLEGCDRSMLDNRKGHFLDYAVKHERILRYLVDELHLNFNVKNANNRSLLYEAIIGKNKDSIQFMMSEKNALDFEESLVPLVYAVIDSENIDLIDVFYKRGVDFNIIDTQNGQQDTLLHYAIKRGKLESVKKLIALGIDPYQQNAEGLNAYQLAESMQRHSDFDISMIATDIVCFFMDKKISEKSPTTKRAPSITYQKESRDFDKFPEQPVVEPLRASIKPKDKN